jgi:multiple sugar transport system permease protein
MMYPRPLPEDRPGLRFAYVALVALVMVLWLLPLLAVMLTATRSYEEIMAGNYWGLIRDFSLWENITTVFGSTAMTRYFLNSLVITVPTVVFVLVLSTLAGFVLSRYRFPGATLIFALFIGGNFLPAQIMMIPVRDLMVQLGLYDTHLALIIFHTAFQTGFATLFMRNFIASLPSELFQAARAEGASPGQILWHVVLPLMRPALAALAILMFTFVWNDYFWSVVLTQSDAVKPVTAGLNNLRGQWTTAWNLVAAGTLFIAIPPVVMFFAMQRHFIAGLTMGAVKG